VRKSSAPYDARFEPAQTGEEEVLSLLKEALSGQLPDSEKDSEGFKNASSFQRSIGSKTDELSGKLSELSKSAVTLSPEITQRLESARAEMEKAAESLDLKNSSKAAEHQIKALEELDKGKQGLDNSQQSQASMETGMTKPASTGMPMSRQTKPGDKGRDGKEGVDISPVKLPGAKDYMPPDEIRKQVMESLEEKYPPSQKQAITDYLKRLSQ